MSPARPQSVFRRAFFKGPSCMVTTRASRQFCHALGAPAMIPGRVPACCLHLSERNMQLQQAMMSQLMPMYAAICRARKTLGVCFLLFTAWVLRWILQVAASEELARLDVQHNQLDQELKDLHSENVEVPSSCILTGLCGPRALGCCRSADIFASSA